jgi:hypothetical protein
MGSVDGEIRMRHCFLKVSAITGAALIFASHAMAANPALYGLIQTPDFNELTAYDPDQINDPGFFGYDANSVAPLNITNLLPQNSISSIAVAGNTAYGLVRTAGFSEVTAYDMTQINKPGFFGYDAKYLAPLNITNLLPQNSITSVAVQGTTLYGLITTSGFNELTAYDLTQINKPTFFGFDANYVAPLNITNLLPQNSISSIAVQGSTLYALVRTAGFDELATYDLTQIDKPGFFGFDGSSLAPLNITNLLPQNSITSITVRGTTLYGLITTPGFNELITYDLTQIDNPDFFGYDATSLGPLDITNLLPQNSIIDIAISPADSGGSTSTVPELSSWMMMIMGFFGLGSLYRRRLQPAHQVMA